MWASIRNECAKVQILVSEGADVSRHDREGRTALHMATIGGCHKCVFEILQAGADPNFSDSWGHTAMHFAANNQDLVEADLTVRTLKEHGGHLDALDNDGWTPLYDAVDRNNVNAVSVLLQHGAAINTCNKENATPISRAVFMNHVEIVKVLCRNGAQFVWKGREQRMENVLEHAARYGSVEVMDIIAETAAEPIEYNPDDMERLFNEERLKSWQSRDKPALNQAERNAFNNLLHKRGKSIVKVCLESDTSISDGGEETTEVFEDALERIEISLL
jgi:ankyrin repeat protein